MTIESNSFRIVMAALAFCAVLPRNAAAQQLSAQESDPRVIGWMEGFPPPPEGWTTMNWFSVLFPLALIFSIFFPLYFRFGYSKGVMLGFISTAVVGFLLMGLFYVMVSIKSGSWGLAQYTEGKESPVLAFITGITGQAMGIFGKQNLLIYLSPLMIPLVVVSILLSIKFYSKREF